MTRRMPPATAVHEVIVTLPKRARGRTSRVPLAVTRAGASTTHRAWIAAEFRVCRVVKLPPLVASRIVSVHELPRLVTVALNRSPGRIVVAGTWACGYISYQAMYAGTVEPARQSASVPICSRSWTPPSSMPTQVATALVSVPLHFTAGWTHDPLTDEIAVPGSCAPYPE